MDSDCVEAYKIDEVDPGTTESNVGGNVFGVPPHREIYMFFQTSLSWV